MPLVTPEILALLRCPRTHSALHEASAELIARVNSAIRAGKLVSRAGAPVAGPIDGGLVNADQTLLFPVYNRAVDFLETDAIELKQL